MFESFVPVAIAVATGVGVLSTQIHRRITQVDRRLDGVELKIAEKYVTRNELSETFKRFEDHLIRIENKMDTCFDK